MDIPKLTVLVPTFNGEKTILGCVDSILTAIDKANSIINLVVIDNNSTDATGKLLKNKLSNLKIARLICNDINLGFEASLSKGIEISESEWIKVLADDDLMSEHFLIKLLNTIERFPESDLIITGGSDRWPEKPCYSSDLISEYNMDLQPSIDSKGCYGQISTLTLRKKSWTSASLKNQKNFGKDFFFMSNCLIMMHNGRTILDSNDLLFIDRVKEKRYITSTKSEIDLLVNSTRMFKFTSKLIEQKSKNKDIIRQLWLSQCYFTFRRVCEPLKVSRRSESESKVFQMVSIARFLLENISIILSFPLIYSKKYAYKFRNT